MSAKMWNNIQSYTLPKALCFCYDTPVITKTQLWFNKVEVFLTVVQA